MYPSLQNYQKTLEEKISTSSPEHLMVMLYEGMVTRIKQAKERFGAGQKIKSHESAIRAMKIADALMENLNMEEGGEVADNLEKIYFFIISQLSKSIRSEDPTPYWDSTLKVLAPLVEGWQKLAERK